MLVNRVERASAMLAAAYVSGCDAGVCIGWAR